MSAADPNPNRTVSPETNNEFFDSCVDDLPERDDLIRSALFDPRALIHRGPAGIGQDMFRSTVGFAEPVCILHRGSPLDKNRRAYPCSHVTRSTGSGPGNRYNLAMTLKSTLRLAGAHRITIHVPASREAWLALLGGDASRLEHDQNVLPLFRMLRAHSEFGALGPYRNVYELSGGHESFTPGHEAKPTFGNPGETSTTASVVITTYVSQSVSQTRIAELVAALAAAHPWELPVIEVCEVRVLAPAMASRP